MKVEGEKDIELHYWRIKSTRTKSKSNGDWACRVCMFPRIRGTVVGVPGKGL